MGLYHNENTLTSLSFHLWSHTMDTKYLSVQYRILPGIFPIKWSAVLKKMIRMTWDVREHWSREGHYLIIRDVYCTDTLIILLLSSRWFWKAQFSSVFWKKVVFSAICILYKWLKNFSKPLLLWNYLNWKEGFLYGPSSNFPCLCFSIFDFSALLISLHKALVSESAARCTLTCLSH